MTSAVQPHSTPRNDDLSEELQPGTTLLQGQYTIDRFLGAGGFALTYLARDSLARPVVIKECFPSSLCVRSNLTVRARSQSRVDELNKIVRLFFREAQRLATLRHPNIVGVHQVFQDHGTAYMALDFIEGPDLLDLIEDGQNPSPAQLRDMLVKLLNAVSYVHDQNILHRDISPDNILLHSDGTPVMIDFGAAREQATRASRVLSSLQIVKDGYSPQEFYVAGAKQGPEGDIYALGATFYHLLTGVAPPNSQIRLAAIAAKEPDPYQPVAGTLDGYDPKFLSAIDTALNVFPGARFPSANDWLDALDGTTNAAASAKPSAPVNPEVEKVISRLVNETNKAVQEARNQEATTKTKPKRAEQKERKAYFKWQFDEDWLNRGTTEAKAKKGKSCPANPTPKSNQAKPEVEQQISELIHDQETGSDTAQHSLFEGSLLTKLNKAFKFQFKASPANSYERTSE